MSEIEDDETYQSDLCMETVISIIAFVCGWGFIALLVWCACKGYI